MQICAHISVANSVPISVKSSVHFFAYFYAFFCAYFCVLTREYDSSTVHTISPKVYVVLSPNYKKYSTNHIVQFAFLLPFSALLFYLARVTSYLSGAKLTFNYSLEKDPSSSKVDGGF